MVLEKDFSKAIVLDTETTGLYPENENILQLSIISGTGEILFNEYFCPPAEKLEEGWYRAERVHHISVDKVRECKPFSFYVSRVMEILKRAECIIAYNARFDIRFLKKELEYAGNDAAVFDDIEVMDVMLDFAPVYGDYNSYYDSYKWQKLETCADYYGYVPEKEYSMLHDSLSDCFATLYCARNLYGDMEQ